MAEDLFQELQRVRREFGGHPPVHKWNPELCGEMDMVIRRDGRWIHEGSEIKRQSLVNLFASILKKEGDDYFLVTPTEKLRIRVEDAPFVATQVARGKEEGVNYLLFTTNTGDVVPLEKGRSWQLKPFGDPPIPIPYIEVRNGLCARVSREVYYQLVEWAEDRSVEDRHQLWLHSGGERFLLGTY